MRVQVLFLPSSSPLLTIGVLSVLSRLVLGSVPSWQELGLSRSESRGGQSQVAFTWFKRVSDAKWAEWLRSRGLVKDDLLRSLSEKRRIPTFHYSYRVTHPARPSRRPEGIQDTEIPSSSSRPKGSGTKMVAKPEMAVGTEDGPLADEFIQWANSVGTTQTSTSHSDIFLEDDDDTDSDMSFPGRKCQSGQGIGMDPSCSQ